MMNLSPDTWTVQVNPDASQVKALRKNLSAYNVAQANVDRGISLAIFLHDEEGRLTGGIYGWLSGKCLEIDYLWIHGDLRGQGIGKELVGKLEAAAASRGAQIIVLDTFSFQAPGFYEKLGYESFGVVEGYIGGHKKYFYRKILPT